MKYIGTLDWDESGNPIVSSMGCFIIECGDFLTVWTRRRSAVVFQGVVALDLLSPEWFEGAFEAELVKRAHLSLVNTE